MYLVAYTFKRNGNINDGYYCGRHKKMAVQSPDVACAKRFLTIRGARQAVRKLRRDYPEITHTVIQNIPKVKLPTWGKIKVEELL